MTNQNSFDLEFLTKKITVLEERTDFLRKIKNDLKQSGKKLSTKQLDLVKQMVPYTSTKETIQENPNIELTNTAWVSKSGHKISPTKEEVRVIIPEIVDPATFKYLKSLLGFGVLSEKQEIVLVRIWDEIVNQGMYTL